MKPNVLVISSGGLKGFLDLGALDYFDNKKLLSEIKYVVGCSVGSLVSLMWIIKYDKIKTILTGMNINLVPKSPNLCLTDIILKNGLFDMDFIENTLRTILIESYGFVPTLKQLYEFSGYEFYIATTNITDFKLEFLNYKSNPNLLTSKAILMSCCIPYLFQEIEYNEHKYRDGALFNPFPIDLLDKDENYTLGISTVNIENYKPCEGSNSFYHNMFNLTSIPLLSIKEKIKYSDRCKILELYSSNDNRFEMYKAGRELAIEFYKKEYAPLIDI